MTILRAVAARHGDVRTYEARLVVPAAAEANRVEQLEDEVAALKEALAALRGAQDRKLADAGEAGRKEGAEAAERDFAQRSASISQAAQDAAAAVAARLAELEGLAVLIAEAAVAQLFAAPVSGGDLVTAAIRRQVAALRRETVLGIHVSASDFPDGAALEAAAHACGNYELTSRSDLSPGACVIKLALGELDLSLPAQWAKLSGLLRQLADEGTAR